MDETSTSTAIWSAVLAGTAVWLLFHALRGWRKGVARQLVEIAALVFAYATAWFGSMLLAPALQPFFALPDFVLRALLAIVLGLLVYAAAVAFGAILFKRTAQQAFGPIRWIYGLGGALAGLALGGATLWLAAIGIRIVGSIAEGQHEAFRSCNDSAAEPGLVSGLRELRKGLAEGPVGSLVERLDPVPEDVHRLLAKVARIAADPAASERFLQFPEAKALSEEPKIADLQNNPEIARRIRERNFLPLLVNAEIATAANDPALRAKLRKFPLEKALDYALAQRSP